MLTIALPSSIPVQQVSAFYQADVSILRADTVHPAISGNKWFKLYYYLQQAIRLKKKGIVTFGGAWSNHIAATAAACAAAGLKCAGIIRGEEPVACSATLQQAKELGMQLQFVSRQDYKEKAAVDFNNEWLLVPEGGYGTDGMLGAAHILDYIPHYTHYCCAAGTGTTLAGMIHSAGEGQTITGISVLKNNHSLGQAVSSLWRQPPKAAWHISHDFHFGGYARYTKALTDFMNRFYTATGIPSDFVYTGKLFFAVLQLLQQGYFPAGSRIAILHSGGLQGNASLPKGVLTF